MDSKLIDDKERKALTELANGKISIEAYNNLINVINKI